MKDSIKPGMIVHGRVDRRVQLPDGAGFKGVYRFRCFDRRGVLKWEDIIENLVVNEGLDEYLERLWKATAYTAQHYSGLTDGTPTVAPTDTMASHPGWTEVTAYSEPTRVDLTAQLGAVSGQSLSTSSSLVYSINGTATVGGAFVSTDNVKGGTAGTLISAGAFTQGDKAVDNGDTLNVDYTFTSAAV